MKSLLVLPILFSLTVCAQAPKKHCIVKPEFIPVTAVEPAYKDQQPYCPRSEYELKWFVGETKPSDFIWHVQTSDGTEYIKPAARLTFIPMCIQKEEAAEN